MTQTLTNLDLLCVANENGTMIPFEHDDVTCMIFKALKITGTNDRLLALNLADKVMHRLKNWNGSDTPLSTNDVELMLRFVLNECGQMEAARQIGDSIQVTA